MNKCTVLGLVLVSKIYIFVLWPLLYQTFHFNIIILYLIFLNCLGLWDEIYP
jgi:hypothetical protein